MAAAVAPASAQRISVSYDNPGSLLIPDTVDAVFRRSDTGTPLPIRFNAPLATEPAARLYFVSTDVTTDGVIARGDFTLRIRVDDIPISCRGPLPWEKGVVWVSGGTNPDVYPTVVAADQGLESPGFIEFTYTLTDYPYGWLGSALYIDVMFSTFDFPCNLGSRLSLEFINPYNFLPHTPAGAEASMTDRYYRFVRYQWKEGLEDGEAITEENKYIQLVPAPMASETVELSGFNLIVRPSSVTTDGDGVFGVFAFVDPVAFDKSSTGGKADAPTFGDLTLKYKQVMQTNRITGNFAEVIQAEGRIAIVDSSSGSTVKVGDILSPGTKLSLSARIGETPAQLGLRFVNGADATVAQDVFTNACITDLIVIGQTEFTNKSVIQGKTPLMSLSRYLCEQMAGFPNTPEEWALFAGKFVVKVAASSVVPVPMGYEAGAFAVKYVVGTAAGKVYDYTMTSPGDNRVIPKAAAPGAPFVAKAITTPDVRVELSTYYDGSTRIAENFDGSVSMFLGAADAPFAATAGTWQELIGAGAIARSWPETLDTIDKAGPQLRMSHEFNQVYWTTTFRLSAIDFSGLDLASLSVTIDGVPGDHAGAFEYQTDGVWVGEFVGSMLPVDYQVHATLADRLGNTSTIHWIGLQMPGPPRALGANFDGAQTWVTWMLPSNLLEADLLYYEVRQYWETLTGWVSSPWQSVGRASQVALDLPAGLKPGGSYRIDVRAWRAGGMAGEAARTLELTPTVTVMRLDVAKTGAGSGTVTGDGVACGDDCVGLYTPGSVITLIATPGLRSTFAGWGGACAGTGTCQVTMDAAKSVTATFALQSFGLTVQTAGNGTVTSSPAGINCGATCAFDFVAGSSVTLTATVSAGSVFVGWSGSGCSGTGTCTVTMNDVAAVSAVFVTQSGTPALTATPASLDFGGQSMGTTSPVQLVTVTNTGTGSVTVSGVSTSNAQFAQTNNSTTLAAGASCTVNVTFSPATSAGAVLSTVAASGSLSITSNATSSPNTVALAGTAEKSLVSHYYRSILRRAPDGGGKAYWDSQALAMQALGANVNETWYAMAVFFFTSPEYLGLNRDNNGFVTDLYNTFFNRPPDGGGLAYWTGQIASGMPREVVLVSFMLSPEFVTFTQGVFGNSAARTEVDTVMDFYRGLLSRLPDSGGFNYWVGQFRTAQCAGAGAGAAVYTEASSISNIFLNGGEYATRNRTNSQFVGDLYNAFLRRGGDLVGVQYWIDQVTSGARTRNQVRLAFIASSEFNTRVNAIIAQGCLP